MGQSCNTAFSSPHPAPAPHCRGGHDPTQMPPCPSPLPPAPFFPQHHQLLQGRQLACSLAECPVGAMLVLPSCCTCCQQAACVFQIEKKDLAWERYYDLTSQELGSLINMAKMGKALHK